MRPWPPELFEWRPSHTGCFQEEERNGCLPVSKHPWPHSQHTVRYWQERIFVMDIQSALSLLSLGAWPCCNMSPRKSRHLYCRRFTFFFFLFAKTVPRARISCSRPSRHLCLGLPILYLVELSGGGGGWRTSMSMIKFCDYALHQRSIW